MIYTFDSDFIDSRPGGPHRPKCTHAKPCSHAHATRPHPEFIVSPYMHARTLWAAAPATVVSLLRDMLIF
jgi:hypothetical protein